MSGRYGNEGDYLKIVPKESVSENPLMDFLNRKIEERKSGRRTSSVVNYELQITLEQIANKIFEEQDLSQEEKLARVQKLYADFTKKYPAQQVISRFDDKRPAPYDYEGVAYRSSNNAAIQGNSPEYPLAHKKTSISSSGLEEIFRKAMQSDHEHYDGDMLLVDDAQVISQSAAKSLLDKNISVIKIGEEDLKKMSDPEVDFHGSPKKMNLFGK